MIKKCKTWLTQCFRLSPNLKHTLELSGELGRGAFKWKLPMIWHFCYRGALLQREEMKLLQYHNIQWWQYTAQCKEISSCSAHQASVFLLNNSLISCICSSSWTAAKVPLLTYLHLQLLASKLTNKTKLTFFPLLYKTSSTVSAKHHIISAWKQLRTYPILSQCMSAAVVFQRAPRLSTVYADKFLLLIARSNLPQQSNAWKTEQSCKWLQSVGMRDQESL